MPILKLLKAPGYVYDLLYIFFFHFNKEQYVKLFSTTEEERSRTQKLLEPFLPCSDDLYVFFHALDHGRCLASVQYFSKYIGDLAEDPPVETFIDRITEKNELVRRVLKFYFFKYSEAEISAILNTPGRVFETVKNSSYSDTEKLRLYEFFLSPDYYIDVLRRELTQKSLAFSAYYEKNFETIKNLFEGLTYEALSEQTSHLKEIVDPQKPKKALYLSFCLLNDRHESTYTVKSKSIKLLGVNRLGAVDTPDTFDVNLEAVGNALNDESRIQMLDMMLSRGRIVCKDLERAFNFSGSTAYHHLMLLTKSRLVLAEPEGKIVYYRINPAAVKKTIEQLERFLKPQNE